MTDKIVALFCLILSFVSYSQTTTLVINEVSNGSGGSKEYFEFLVIGPTPTGCQAPTTLDLRNWIVDDNNGYIKGGGQNGIAAGAFRFKNDAFWSAIPVGTLITIYNHDDFDNSLITRDISMTDGNCKLTIPSNSALLEMHTSKPETNNPTYSTTGWVAANSWSQVSLNNTKDGVLIFSPNSLTIPVHSFGYGYLIFDNQPNIHFTGSGSSKVFSMKNTNSDDYNNINNWVSETATGTTQTPGRPNNPENERYILSLNNGCQTATNSNLSINLTSTDVSCNASPCDGSASLIINGGTAPYQVNWSTGSTNNSITNICAGTYAVTVEDATGCEKTDSVVVNSQGNFTLTTSTDVTICIGESTTLTASGAASYVWGNNLGTGSNITVTPTTTTTYTVTGSANGCSQNKSITVTVVDINNFDAGTNATICMGTDYTFNAGNGNITWSNGATNGQSLAFNTVGTFVYYAVIASGNCQAMDSVIITVKDCSGPTVIELPNVFTPNGDGVNDVFEATKAINVTLSNFTILNRWGNIMYTNDQQIIWDGKSNGIIATPGTYFYTIRYKDNDSKDQTLHGFFELVK